MKKKKDKRRRISLAYMMLAVLTAMLCSGIFRPVLFETGESGREQQAENAYPKKSGEQDFQENGVHSEDVVSSGVSAGSGEQYASGAYADVYHFLDTLEPIGHRQLQIEQEEKGIYDIHHSDGVDDFKILQLTDIHLTGTGDLYKKDILAVDAVYTMVQRTNPDLIVVTGDVIFGRDGYPTEEGLRAWNVFSNLMDIIGIPWTWTFGNHDHTFFDSFSEEETEQMLSQCKTLYRCNAQGELSGYTNGTLRLKTCDGNLCSAIILLDSQNEIQKEDGTRAGYDYIKQDQIAWYEQQITSLKSASGETAVSMVFMHIPIEEYKTAWEAVQKNSGEASYIEGNSNEIVSCSPVQTELFEKAVALGSTKAFFSGHDHLNNFHVVYQGIHLVYAKSIDFVAYRGIDLLTEQRGATLIEIAGDGRFSVRQLRLEE